MKMHQLKQFIEDQEANWTAEQTEYLGDFLDQDILCCKYEWDESSKQSNFCGYTTNSIIVFDITGLGYIIDERV